MQDIEFTIDDGRLYLLQTRSAKRTAAIGFCDRLGLDYVSCLPYWVPTARLAAAQSALATAGVGVYVQAGG